MIIYSPTISGSLTVQNITGDNATLFYLKGADGGDIFSTQVNQGGPGGAVNIVTDSGSINYSSYQLKSSQITLSVASTVLAGSVGNIQINNQGLFIIGTPTSPPTPVAGGIYFDGTDFYLGM